MKTPTPVGSFIVFVLSMLTLGGLLWFAFTEKQRTVNAHKATLVEEISPNDYYWVSSYVKWCPAVEPIVANAMKNDGIVTRNEYNNISSEYDKLCLTPAVNKHKTDLQNKYAK